MKSEVRKRGFYLALVATLLASIVVGLGAYTRLVHAGLGCPDWPGCYGFLTVPETAQEISQAEQLYPNAPVEVDKGWPEMIHRYVAGSLMLLVMGIVFQAFKYRREPNRPIILPVFILVLITLQAAFGMWTVTLKLWPQVVTAHLLGGFATFSLLFLLTLRLSGMQRQFIQGAGMLRTLGLVGLLLVIIQITLGGWTSSNYAALACPDLPTCQNHWLPPMDFAEGFNINQAIGPNYLGGQLDGAARTAIHFSHRIGAILTLLMLSLLIIKTFTLTRNVDGHERGVIRLLASVVLIVLTLQICLGLSNIIWSLPLGVAVAHNLGGALLLLSMVAYNYRLKGRAEA
ncbi:cytochrome B [Endozoicomonas sp. (ex Bugula neritina AB1)]|nr:cytochrome B [Endozoicomonas sp. (ex Bugula neritina AB1)]